MSSKKDKTDVNIIEENKREKGFLKTAITAAVIAGLCFGFMFLGNYAATKGIFLVKTSDMVKSTAAKINDTGKYSLLFTVRDTILEKFDGEIDDEKLLEGAVKGMTSSLEDPYTVYMNAEEFDDFLKQADSSFTGIGIRIGADKDDRIIVLSVMKDSPAEKAGLKSKDIIKTVDGKDVTGSSLKEFTKTVADAEGETLKLTVEREGEKQPVELEVVPGEMKVSVIDGKMIDNKMGYIRIKSFMNEDTTKDFADMIKSFENKGMEGLVLDLRENPGGLLTEAIGVASQFLPKDKLITYTVDKYENKDESLSTGGAAEGMPLVLLVNGNSASASEVVTGALRDYKAATIVGENTFGKGIVQQSIKFNDNLGGIKITVSKYYTPNGENIHKIGIKPDIEVKSDQDIDTTDYDETKDEQLLKAEEILTEKINSK